MGVRTRSRCRTVGIAGRVGGRKDQKARSAALRMGARGGAGVFAPLAPFSIQVRIRVFWSEVSLLLPGGILSAAMWIHSRLFSGDPGETAGPPSPPLSRPA